MTETPRDDKPKPARRPRIKLPFDNRREDVGSWTYDHRIGLCVTLIAYLALMIVFVSSKIVVGRRTHQQGMYIDLQTLAEMEQERDRLERDVRLRQRTGSPCGLTAVPPSAPSTRRPRAGHVIRASRRLLVQSCALLCTSPRIPA